MFVLLGTGRECTGDIQIRVGQPACPCRCGLAVGDPFGLHTGEVICQFDRRLLSIGGGGLIERETDRIRCLQRVDIGCDVERPAVG